MLPLVFNSSDCGRVAAVVSVMFRDSQTQGRSELRIATTLREDLPLVLKTLATVLLKRESACSAEIFDTLFGPKPALEF